MGFKITIFDPMSQRFCYLILSCLFLCASCVEEKVDEGLRSGDLLFQDLDCGPMCTAIETVTEGVNGMDFSHCAMVIKENDSLKVIEAIGESVQVTSLKDFKQRSNKIVAARLKKVNESLIIRAVSYAKSLKGKPYDEVFLLNNDRYYCSELLYESFKVANYGNPIFELAPMTFMDPATKAYYPVWVDYYHELNCPIPEGKPGLNPGSISRSDQLEILQVDIKP
jgi:hypothetical protein